MLEFIQNIEFGELMWSEFIYALVGSFVGIFLPLWIDKSRARRQEKVARQKMLSSLDRELQSVKELIEKHKDAHNYSLFSFSTFVWESIIAAGMLPDLLSDKKIDSELLIEIYAHLAILTELHNDFCHYEKDDNLKDMYTNIVDNWIDIHEKICRYQNSGNKR